MFRQILGVLAITLILSISLKETCAEENTKSLLVMSYNVEQLYDNIDNEGVKDERFLVTSNPAYTDERVTLKLENISQMILTARDGSYFGEGPDVVGLVEVENQNIVNMLAATLNSKLKGAKYKAVYIPGEDVSGINPAILSKFPISKIISHKAHKESLVWQVPSFSGELGKPVYTVTRNILEAQIKIDDQRQLTVFVNHWPAKNESYQIVRRYECGRYLNQVIADRLAENPNLDILVTGDFNSQPEDADLAAGLNVSQFLDSVKSSSLEQPVLYGAAYDIYNKSSAKKAFYDASRLFKKHFHEFGVWDVSIFDNVMPFIENRERAEKIINKLVANGAYDSKKYRWFETDLLGEVLRKRGTFYYYRDRLWNTLDSIQLTKTLFDGMGLDYQVKSFRIHKPEFAQGPFGRPVAFHKCKRTKPTGGPCMKDANGKTVPQNGYSDHYPVLVNLSWRP